MDMEAVNAVDCDIFHGWLLFSSNHIVAVLLFFIATALAGYLMGWINEKNQMGPLFQVG
ncbi:hypothetical protein ACOMCU_12690 [Lysinibacillus sp. UGB7]|uniref:hypothetical protein n=1 Tax=Lysinibacillus sp. UGB7 TaxID=3411039 RepID=UPI003B7B0FBA